MPARKNRAAFSVTRRAPPGLFHQARTAGAGNLVLLHDAEPAGDFGIGLDHAAEILAESVLVHLVVGLDVPQTAGIGADLVGKDDTHVLAFPQPAAFDLEIDEADADAEEEA